MKGDLYKLLVSLPMIVTGYFVACLGGMLVMWSIITLQKGASGAFDVRIDGMMDALGTLFSMSAISAARLAGLTWASVIPALFLAHFFGIRKFFIYMAGFALLFGLHAWWKWPNQFEDQIMFAGVGVAAGLIYWLLVARRL